MNLDFKAFPNPEPFFNFAKVFQTYHHPICQSCWNKAIFNSMFDIFMENVRWSRKNPTANIRTSCFPTCLNVTKKLRCLIKWLLKGVRITIFNTCNCENTLPDMTNSSLRSFLKFTLQIISITKSPMALLIPLFFLLQIVSPCSK